MSKADILDTPLLRLTPEGDCFRLRDAVQGVAVFGGIGSGKTTGPGSALAGAFLKSGMGGCICVAKSEDIQLWRDYCAKYGRTASLIEFDPTQGYNFLEHELSRHDGDGANAAVECLMRVLEMGRAASPTPHRAGEVFWEEATKQLLRHSVPVLYAAGSLRIDELVRFIQSAPRSPEEMRDPEWQQSSYFCACFAQAAPNLSDAMGAQLTNFWRHQYATLDAKTRSNIAISLTTILDRFNHGWLKSAFCGRTSILPEATFHGAIILLAMPALTLNEDGIFAQQLFKYMWQRAVLARNALAPQHHQRPVFLWADEAHIFCNSQDAEYLALSRASLACTVFLSQTLPTYYAKLGNDGGRDRVHHLLGNLATKIWNNLGGCAETAEWAAKTLGRSLQWRENYSYGEGTGSNSGMGMSDGSSSGGSSGHGGGFSYGANGQWQSSSNWNSGSNWGENESQSRNRGTNTSRNSSRGASQQMDYILEPGAFSALKTGGPANRNRVSAVWYQSGRCFQASSNSALMVEFQQ